MFFKEASSILADTKDSYSNNRYELFKYSLVIVTYWKSCMSNVNFCNLCLKIFMEKKKPAGPRFYWYLTSSISVCCWSNVKSHTGWSIFLCSLSENECSEQVSEKFRNGKIFRRQKFLVGNIIFVGIDYSSVKTFVT